MSVRERILSVFESCDLELDGELRDDASLIRSGLLDSAALFNLALLIESEVGSEIDPGSFDLTAEWDTIADIEEFIAQRRAGA